MKEVKLASGREVEIAPLTVRQARQMSEQVDKGEVATATVAACVNSMNNAKSDTITFDKFELTFTVPEANELFKEVAEITELKVGESTASR